MKRINYRSPFDCDCCCDDCCCCDWDCDCWLWFVCCCCTDDKLLFWCCWLFEFPTDTVVNKPPPVVVDAVVEPFVFVVIIWPWFGWTNAIFCECWIASNVGDGVRIRICVICTKFDGVVCDNGEHTFDECCCWLPVCWIDGCKPFRSDDEPNVIVVDCAEPPLPLPFRLLFKFEFAFVLLPFGECNETDWGLNVGLWLCNGRPVDVLLVPFPLAFVTLLKRSRWSLPYGESYPFGDILFCGECKPFWLYEDCGDNGDRCCDIMLTELPPIPPNALVGDE